MRGGAAGAEGDPAARPPVRFAVLLAAGLVVSACTSSTATGPRPSGGGNWAHAGHPGYKVGAPYQINGVWYYPKVDYAYDETGVASWYGEAFDKQLTANGEIFDLNDLTAAHRTLPLPSVVEVINLQNGRAMQLRVNDRGPFAQNRILDVSRRAAQLLGFERSGTTPVHVRILKDESVQVAEAAMRGSSGNVQLAANAAPALAAARQTAERPVAVAQLAPPPQPAPLRQTAATEVIASQPRPNPPEPAPRPAPIEVTAAAPRPNPPPRRAPWYSPIATAQAETLPRAPRPAPADRIVDPAPAAAAAAIVHGGSRIFIQAAAFSVPGNAQRARTRIAALGSVQILPTSVRGAELFRVRVGPVGSPAEADRLVTRLIQNGYPDARIVNE